MEEASLQQAGASAQPSIIAPAVPSDASLPSTSRQHDQQLIDDDHNGTPQDQQSSSYKASEIATRFIEVIDPKSPHVDTAAPIDSVKGAVNKFGGILDWREKRKQSQDDPDKVQEEAREYHKRSQAAEAGKAQALHELETTASAADKLRLSLKKAQIEEAQARQEADLAERRLRESERGATERAAAEAELGAVRDRRAAALADLQAARAEVLSLEKVRAAAAAEACAAVARAREAAAESRETGKAVEELADEIVALKGELETSHAAHVEAEEKRLRLALALEEDKSRWQMELEEAQHEAKRLRDELMAACDVEMKAEAASELMAKLKAELLACTVVVLQADGHKPTTVTLDKVRKELEDVKASVDQAKGEAKCLRLAAAAMRDDLDRGEAELAALRRREGLSSASIPYLREELSRVTSDLAAAEAAAAKADDESKMAGEQVGDARREAEEAKAKVRSAREEIAKAREETAVARAAVATMEARLEAVTREILAATTSEEITTASAAALLQEISIKPSRKAAVVEGGVTLTVEEYDELSRRARETEEIAGKRVMEAVKLIKEAKDAEVRSLEKLAKVDRQTEQRRQALEAATLEAEEAEFEKLSAERELRQWHADHDPERRRAAGEAGSSPRTGLAEISVLHDHPGGAGDGRGNPHILSPRGGYMPRTESMAAEAEARGQRKTTTFFPRMVMFLARKRAQSWK